MPGPMDGVRVVEMCVAVTGPLAVGLLVDQGADAIKVEEPGFGDQGRYVGVVSGGISALFQMCNRGKRSVAVDCTDPRGREIVLDLCAEADVFVQNMRPGVVERLGVGYGEVSARNPKIVYLSLSGFGPDGPYAHRRVYDSVIQAQSGLVGNQTGINDDSPRFLRQAAADKVTAYTAAQAINACAVRPRPRHGGPAHPARDAGTPRWDSCSRTRRPTRSPLTTTSPTWPSRSRRISGPSPSPTDMQWWRQ